MCCFIFLFFYFFTCTSSIQVVCLFAAQGCCSALRWRQRSSRWGTTGGASSPPPSAPSSSECWQCGTRRKVEVLLHDGSSLPVCLCKCACFGFILLRSWSLLKSSICPAPFSSNRKEEYFVDNAAFFSPFILKRPSLLSSRPASALTSRLTFRSCPRSPSLGESFLLDQCHIKLIRDLHSVWFTEEIWGLIQLHLLL